MVLGFPGPQKVGPLGDSNVVNLADGGLAIIKALIWTIYFVNLCGISRHPPCAITSLQNNDETEDEGRV